MGIHEEGRVGVECGQSGKTIIWSLMLSEAQASLPNSLVYMPSLLEHHAG
jgi:hypothetical protein